MQHQKLSPRPTVLSWSNPRLFHTFIAFRDIAPRPARRRHRAEVTGHLFLLSFPPMKPNFFPHAPRVITFCASLGMKRPFALESPIEAVNLGSALLDSCLVYELIGHGTRLVVLALLLIYSKIGLLSIFTQRPPQ